MKKIYKYIRCEELEEYGEWDIMGIIPSHYPGKEDMVIVGKPDYSDYFDKHFATKVDFNICEKEN